MKNRILILAGTITFASLTAQADSKVDFVKDIQPILQKSCVECHGPEKQRGKLRLDTKEFAFKESDPPILVPGKPDESELYRRIILPADDDDVMPNKGEPLTKAQTDLFLEWIKQGAEWPESAVVKATPSTPVDTKALNFKPTDAEQKAIAALETAGISARPIAMNVPWREVSFHLLGSNITDQSIAPIKDILSLVSVNLAGTKITDAGLAHLSSLTNLTRLHLEKTAVTDQGLQHLKPHVSLNDRNLYGTAITDAGLEHLKGLTNLTRLYLWQTKVTDDGVAALKQALTNVEISRGWELQVAAKESEPAEEKKEEKKE